MARYDNAEFAERIARLPLSRQPGTLWRYGHSTDIVGRVIEIVSGQTLYQFEKQHIFDPLGMTSTKYLLDTPEERARMAEPLPDDMILRDAERERRAHPEWQSGGGGLVSTITDYARFAQMMLNGGELDGKRYLIPVRLQGDDIGPDRSGLRRRTRLLLFSRRWFWLWLRHRGADRSRQRQTTAARLDQRIEVGQRQRHLFRRRSQARHDLHHDGADRRTNAAGSRPRSRSLSTTPFRPIERYG